VSEGIVGQKVGQERFFRTTTETPEPWRRGWLAHRPATPQGFGGPENAQWYSGDTDAHDDEVMPHLQYFEPRGTPQARVSSTNLHESAEAVQARTVKELMILHESVCVPSPLHRFHTPGGRFKSPSHFDSQPPTPQALAMSREGRQHGGDREQASVPPSPLREFKSPPIFKSPITGKMWQAEDRNSRRSLNPPSAKAYSSRGGPRAVAPSSLTAQHQPNIVLVPDVAHLEESVELVTPEVSLLILAENSQEGYADGDDGDGRTRRHEADEDEVTQLGTAEHGAPIKNVSEEGQNEAERQAADQRGQGEVQPQGEAQEGPLSDDMTSSRLSSECGDMSARLYTRGAEDGREESDSNSNGPSLWPNRSYSPTSGAASSAGLRQSVRASNRSLSPAGMHVYYAGASPAGAGQRAGVLQNAANARNARNENERKDKDQTMNAPLTRSTSGPVGVERTLWLGGAPTCRDQAREAVREWGRERERQREREHELQVQRAAKRERERKEKLLKCAVGIADSLVQVSPSASGGGEGVGGGGLHRIRVHSAHASRETGVDVVRTQAQGCEADGGRAGSELECVTTTSVTVTSMTHSSASPSLDSAAPSPGLPVIKDFPPPPLLSPPPALSPLSPSPLPLSPLFLFPLPTHREV